MIFRADANSEIGYGHLMRTLSLASEARRKQYSPLLMTSTQTSSLLDRFHENRIPTEALQSTPGSLNDAQETKQLAVETNSDWMILDGYHFHEEYLETIQHEGCNLLIIDDMAHLERYPCDILLNTNVTNQCVYQGKTQSETTLLTGPRFVLLRPEFRRELPGQPRFPGTATNILVTFGATERGSALRGVGEILSRTKHASSLSVNFILGRFSSGENLLRKADYPFSYQVINDVRNLSDFMNRADLAIASASTTAWELAYLGVPSALVVLNDDQLRVCEHLTQNNAARRIEWNHPRQQNQAVRILNELLHNRSLRKTLSDNAQQLVDGRGTSRVIKRFRKRQLTLRPVRPADRSRLWRWSNDPDVRRFAFDPNPIGWTEHKTWFSSIQADENCTMYIAETSQSESIGGIRFEPEDGQITMSVVLDREKRGKGYGSAVIEQATDRFFSNTEHPTVHAWIKIDNEASRHAFRLAGYQMLETVPKKGERAHHFVKYKQR